MQSQLMKNQTTNWTSKWPSTECVDFIIFQVSTHLLFEQNIIGEQIDDGMMLHRQWHGSQKVLLGPIDDVVRGRLGSYRSEFCHGNERRALGEPLLVRGGASGVRMEI